MVEIKTERLLLREYRSGDAARVAEIANNKKIAQNMTNIFPYPYTLKDAEEWIKIASEPEKAKNTFVVEFDGEIIGGAGFDLKDDVHEGVASGGYWFGEDSWGKGFATEVWKAVVYYAFENFDIRRVEAGVYSWNPASEKVQKKCGFSREGCLRSSVTRFGKVGDEIKYGMTREDWEALKNG